MAIENKLIFQVVHGDDTVINTVVALIRELYPVSTVYTATNGAEAIQKMCNVPPHILVTALELTKLSITDLLTNVIQNKTFAATAIVVLSNVPEQELHIDDVVNGRIQFVPMPVEKKILGEAVAKGLAAMKRSTIAFSMRTIKAGDILFREGEKAASAFLVKTGKLKAYNERGQKQVILGEVRVGEFVGEMALLNGEERSATVEAIENCELIEIPLGSLDALVFSKPAWSKALVKTLAQRLKTANAKD